MITPFPRGFRRPIGIASPVINGALPKMSDAVSDHEDSGRILCLSGTWQIPGEAYSFTATIRVGADGAAAGPIQWRAECLHGASGIEDVRGHVAIASVRLHGVKAERGLACDQYRVTLMGDDRSGIFAGISRAFGSWNGRMEGAYFFVRGTSER